MEKDEIIYGRHPVLEALDRGRIIDKVWLQTGTRGPLQKELRQLSKEHGFVVQMVPKEKLSKITNGNNHQGVAAFVAAITYHKLENLIPRFFESGMTPLLVLLDGITDVRNLGAIARSAECMGVDALVIPRTGTALANAEAIKTSAGALNLLPVCRETSIQAAVEQLQQSGFQVVVSDLKAQKKLSEIDFSQPTAIIMGSEDEGVQPALLRKADDRFIIPQQGVTDSLNVSVATGVILYEAMRQRIG